MSVNAENVAGASEQSDAEKINIINDQITPKLIEERIRMHLEPPEDQILTFTHSLKQLIQVNLAKATQRQVLVLVVHK